MKTLGWLRDNPKTVLDVIWVLVLMIIVGMIVYNTTTSAANSKSAQEQANNTRKVVDQLIKADKARQKAVEDLVNDNAQQTLILCKIILNDSARLDPAEAADVEAICKSRIEQDNLSANPSLGGGNTSETNNSGPVSQEESSSNPTPNNSSPQSNNPQSDNEGVIIDLPLLPKIPVPSPF